jgi:predicted small secreted protein
MSNIRGTVVKLAILAAAALSLSACHTFNGLGQDIKEGGRAIQRAANM